MADRRAGRGAHPEDARLFASDAEPVLREAVSDLSWLLTRGYAMDSSLKLVGDRFQLESRQRLAVMRASCSDQARDDRRRRQVPPEGFRGQTLVVDGFNVLTTIEAALSGGVLLLCRDGCLRDMASMHGSYRKVTQTQPALELIGGALAQWRPATTQWLLDQPVSNSGRLKAIMAEVAEARGWTWDIQVVPSPDALLVRTDHIAATADSAVLDRCGRWFNLAREVAAGMNVAALDLTT